MYCRPEQFKLDAVSCISDLGIGRVFHKLGYPLRHLFIGSKLGWLIESVFLQSASIPKFFKNDFFVIFVFASVADPEPLLVWIRLQLITKILVQKTCSVIFVIFVMFIDSNELYETVRT